MLEICDLCKVLSNPLRLELLAHIYQTKDGCNFGYLVDKMQESKLYEPGLCSSGVSQYLRELVRINIVRRHRDGCYTNYHTDLSHAPKSIAEITALIIKRMPKDTNRDFARVFPALMNPFRATVVRMLAKSGPLSAGIICEKTKHQSIHLHRDLKPALNAGLIAETHLSKVEIIYHYIQPIDPIIVCIMNHLLAPTT
jgi:DNA-binding transcriptional ArsR family regulator